MKSITEIHAGTDAVHGIASGAGVITGIVAEDENLHRAAEGDIAHGLKAMKG